MFCGFGGEGFSLTCLLNDNVRHFHINSNEDQRGTKKKFSLPKSDLTFESLGALVKCYQRGPQDGIFGVSLIALSDQA